MPVNDSRLYGSFSFPGLPQRPPAYQHQRSPYEKTNIPVDPLLGRHGLIDMMDAEQMMIDDAFHKMEDSKTHQYRAGQHFARPGRMRLARFTPENCQAGGCENVGRNVKETVPHNIEFKIIKIVRGEASTGQHVMPLQNLMKDNSIKETAKPESEENSGHGWKAASVFLFCFIPFASPSAKVTRSKHRQPTCSVDGFHASGHFTL